MTIFTDETVMRYVDGELDDATCAEIEAALASDPELEARIEMFARTRLSAQDALKPMLDEPVPDALRSSIEAMVARSRQSTANQGASWHVGTAKPRKLVPANDWRRLAAAASVACIFGLAVGYMAGDRGEPSEFRIAQVDARALSAALRSAPSGAEQELPGTSRFRAIASFRDDRQALCREFELDMADNSTLISVACDQDGQWLVRFAINVPAGDGGYAPASSSEALNTFLATIQAGEPMSADEERRALEALARQME